MAKINITDNEGNLYAVIDTEEWDLDKTPQKQGFLSEILEWVEVADSASNNDA